MKNKAPSSKTGHADLEARLRKLAADKSTLQLVVQLMDRMSAVPGLDNTVDNMLRAVGDVIGGVNVILYYRIGDELRYADICGVRKRVDALDDDLVRKAFETGEPVEREHPFGDTRMLTPEFSKAYTWAVPLRINSEIVGVLKMESLHLAMRELSDQLPTVFSHAALVLGNEIERYWKQMGIARLAAMVQSSDDAIIGKTLEGIITSWNRGAETVYGYTESEAIGTSITHLAPPGREDEALQILARIREGQHVEHFETVRRRKDGRDIHVSLTVSPIRDAAGRIVGASTIARDITGSKRAEAELRRLNRELQAISNCNQTLMRAEDEPTLLREICRIVCEEAGYRMAWVGFAENDEARTVRPVAWAGCEEGYLASAGIQWADTARGRGPSGSAIRNGEHVCIQDFTTDPRAAPWRAAAAQRGYRSSIALPLKDASRTPFGVLNIYSTEPDAFTPDEVRLLSELAGDLAYGLVALRTRAEHKRAEEQRKAHVRFLESLEQIDQAIQRETDVERMLRGILQTVFSLFDSDRVWLFYPCDPDAPTFRVPMEIVRPEYPGAEVLNTSLPMPPEMARDLREVLAADEPLAYAAGTDRPVNRASAERFGVQSQIMMALYPKTGSPWVFGMHQCSHPRVWTREETRLFKEIGKRISDGLSSVLFLRQLRENEERFRATFEQAAVGIAHVARDGRWLRVNQKLCDIVGYSREELLGKTFQDITHPDDLAADLDFVRRMLAGEIPTYSMEKRYLRKGGAIVWINLTVALVGGVPGEPGYFISVVEDITERKRAEAEMRRLNRELGAISNCNQTLMHAEDEQTLLDDICRIVCAEAGYRMAWVGYTDEGDSGRLRPVARAGTDSESPPPAGEAAARAGNSSCIQDIAGEACASPWRDAALKCGYRSCIRLPLKDGLGVPFGALQIFSEEPGIFTPAEIRLLEELAADLSFGIMVLRARVEHERAEQRIALLSLALSKVHDAAFLVDEHGRFQYVNEEACRSLGYSQEELLALHVADIHPEVSAANWSDHWAELKAHHSLTFEGRHRTKDARVFPVEVNVTYFEYDGVGFNLALVRDITDRKRSETEQVRLVTVIEQAAETIVITDLAGSILYANPAFEKITGYSREEARGQNPRILQSGRHDAAFYRQLWDTLLRGEVWRGRFVNKRKDGIFYEEDAIISPIRDATGTIINYAAIKRDVSHEVQLEQQVQQVQKMEAVGRLAGGVAHDFNNILQAILGFCEILLDDTPKDDRRQLDIREIQKCAVRASGLTRQLLAFGRRQMISPTVLNLNTLISNTEKMLVRLLGEDIRLSTSLAPDLLRVRADAGQLEQVVMNLAVNARDAMPEGGQISIGTRNIAFEPQDLATLPDARPGEYVCMSVTDSGTGMSEEVQSHIFEPFFSTKGPGKGTGLGLAVIYGIVKQHNGWIHVYSQIGQGSTFAVYLPAYVDREDPLLAPPGASVPPPRGGGERILLVEDEVDVRNLAIRMLRSGGYEVTAAENAATAEAVFAREGGRFDLVFSDVVLPDHSGIELTMKFRAKRPDLSVLLCSGYTDDRARWTAIEEHGFHFLEKPYPSAKLLHTIRAILDSRPPPA